MREQIEPARRLLASTLLLCAVCGLAVAGRSFPNTALARPRTDTTAPIPESTLGPVPAATTASGPAAPVEPAPQPLRGEQRIEQVTPTRTPTPINIGNFVWDDLDKDGIQDGGEPGLPNITVQLWNASKTQLLDSAVTNASGNYTVVASLPGDYRIRVLLPSILDSFSPKNQGGDDQKDSEINPSGTHFGFSDIFTLGSNIISTVSRDAGIIVFRLPTPTRTPTPINIGNFVWFDLNGNGLQDTGEPGVANVAVQLWNAERTQLLDETTTNANGNYTVVAPIPGDYRIRVLLPPGASFAPKDAGVDDQKDSDINRQVISNLFGFSDTISLASNVISTVTWDAGLLNVPPTPTGTLPTATPTNTRTPTATLPPGTPSPGLEQRLYLPLLHS